MKAPKYQRAEVLHAALREAVQTLNDPVEGLVVTGDGVVAWADGRHILMSYRWDNGHDDAGRPLLGSGAWTAQYVTDCNADFSEAAGGTTSTRHWWSRLWRVWR
ncbi:MAG: hypothetical protein ABI035_11670 [Gemmatimonadaceae bacterium]